MDLAHIARNYEANRAVTELVNRLAPFSEEGIRRKVLDLAPGNTRNTRFLFSLGYHIVALQDEKADAEILKNLTEMPQLCKDCEEYNAQQQKRPVNPKNLLEYELVDRLPEGQFDGIIAIHAFIDLSPAQLRYFVDYINDHTKPKGYLAFTTRTTQPNPFPKWMNVPDWKTKYTGRDEKRKTETLNLAMVIERLMRKPRK
ncbi:Uncharacterised protein [uncultured archaeon]|nr:Uncharacterised protein [uncultured archaeon]